LQTGRRWASFRAHWTADAGTDLGAHAQPAASETKPARTLLSIGNDKKTKEPLPAELKALAEELFRSSVALCVALGNAWVVARTLRRPVAHVS
jgi:hypothetical protein